MSSKTLINKDLISSRTSVSTKAIAGVALSSRAIFKGDAGHFDSFMKNSKPAKIESPAPRGKPEAKDVAKKDNRSEGRNARADDAQVEEKEIKKNNQEVHKSKSTTHQVANDDNIKKKASRPADIKSAKASKEVIELDQEIDELAEMELAEMELVEEFAEINIELVETDEWVESIIVEDIDLSDEKEVANNTIFNGVAPGQVGIKREELISGAPQEETDEELVELDDPLMDEEDEAMLNLAIDEEALDDDLTDEENVVAAHLGAHLQNTQKEFDAEVRGAASASGNAKQGLTQAEKQKEVDLPVELKEFAKNFVNSKGANGQNNKAASAITSVQISDANSKGNAQIDKVIASSPNLVLAEVSSKAPANVAQRLFSNTDKKMNVADEDVTELTLGDIELDGHLVGKLDELAAGKNAGKKGGLENNTPKGELAMFGGEIISKDGVEHMVVTFRDQLDQESGRMANRTEQLKLSLEQAVKNGKSEVKVNLHPKALGAVDVTIEYAQNDRGEKIIQKIKIEAEQRQTLEMFEKSKEELVKSLTTVEEMNEDTSLEFDLKREDKNQGEMLYSDQEEREKWMNRFEQGEGNRAAGDESGEIEGASNVDGYVSNNVDGYIGLDGVNVKV